MDEQLTLHELQRLETERRLRTIPRDILETAWVREAQIEAVIDAVLAIIYCGDVAAYAHARHVGEWCARIAAVLPNAPDPTLARRVGVLADVDPTALEQIAELKHVAVYVRAYKHAATETYGVRRAMMTIVAVADEFDARISIASDGCASSPTFVLQSMLANASAASRAVINALCKAAHFSLKSKVA